MTITFTFERSTKNTHRYLGDGDDPMIPVLYIKKAAFDGEAPTTLSVEITAT